LVGETNEDVVRHTLTVPVSADRAFALFTEEFATWYPREYTWSQDVLDTIAIEGREGGRCFERGPHGFWVDWGRVLVWDPPRRLAFSWQISPRREPVPDPEKSSEVEIRFHEDEAQSTRVEFEHRGFSRHGEGAEGYRQAMGSERGWSYILDRYAAASSQT
jgi:uncharacterized protein YndB with AHSA1/START domain